jgi:hypothetical protein
VEQHWERELVHSRVANVPPRSVQEQVREVRTCIHVVIVVTNDTDDGNQVGPNI